MNKKIKFRFENNQSNDSSYENKQIKWSSLNKTAKTNGQLFFISDIDKLEMDIQKFAYVIDKKIVESSIDSYDDQMASYLKDIGRYDKEKNWSSQTSGYYKLNYYPKVKAIMERQGFTNK